MAPESRSPSAEAASAPRLQPVRWALWTPGLAVIGWAFFDPRFRDVEGALDTPFCLALSAGLGLLLLGSTAGGHWRRTGAWLALALAGQASALQLIDAGTAIHYQHYRPPNDLSAASLAPLLVVGVQAVLVTAGIARRWKTIRAWMAANFKPWQIAAAGLALGAGGAAVSPRLSDYLLELSFAAAIQCLSLGAIVLAAWAAPGRALAEWTAKLERWAAPVRDSATGWRFDRLTLAGAVWVTALAAVLNVAVYERHPHVPDEVAYWLHARFLAGGALRLPAPPAPEAFDLYLMQIDGGEWYPVPPPGWPAVLAVGMATGLPWLVNPLLAGLNVVLAHALTRRLYDISVARWVVLFLCVSPWHIFMAMNFMTHTLTLTGALLGAVAVLRARDAGPGHAGWAAVAGAVVGLTSLIRLLDALILLALLGLWALGLGGRRLGPAALAALGLGVAMFGATTPIYNYRMTGDAARIPIDEYTDERFGPNANAYGFGPDRGMGWPIDPFPGHGPLDALVNAGLNTFQLNTELFGWGTGSLLLAALFVARGPLRRGDYPMLAVIAVVFAAYFFYYFSGGPDFGARYWYLMLIPLAALTAGGLRRLAQQLGTIDGLRVPAAVLGLSAMALINYFPWRAIDKYHHYLGMRPDIRRLAVEHDFGPSLVLVRGEGFPDYASAAVYNPLDFQALAPIYAWDRDEQARAAVVAAYPDRPVWIVDGPTVTGDGYRVAAGPLPASLGIEAP